MLASPIEFHSPRAELIRATAVFIWDEAPMANRAVLACVNETMQRATGSSLPFGGKVVILLGDFRQTCPVICKGTRRQVVDASIGSSPLWTLFHIFRLTVPIRNARDAEFAAYVDWIGNGAGPEIPIAFLASTSTAEELLQFVFPHEVLEQPLLCVRRSILAPTNRQVDQYNNTIIRCIDGNHHTFFAADSLKEVTEAGSCESIPSDMLDYLQQHQPPGLPPYTLEIKTNCVYRLMRNFSLDRGLVKNVRALIKHVGRRVITISVIREDAGGNNISGEDVLIPRILFTYSIPGTGYTLHRRQFPLAPAYATTFNSCQGLTLDRVGVDLTRPVFSHGQLYTAFSRIRHREDGMVRVKPGQTCTTNVTYEEILL